MRSAGGAGAGASPTFARAGFRRLGWRKKGQRLRDSAGPGRSGSVAGAGPTRPLGGRERARAGEALAPSSAPLGVCAER